MKILEERRAKYEEEKLKKQKQSDLLKTQAVKLEIVVEEEDGDESDSDSGSSGSEYISESEYDSKNQCLDTAKAVSNEADFRENEISPSKTRKYKDDLRFLDFIY